MDNGPITSHSTTSTTTRPVTPPVSLARNICIAILGLLVIVGLVVLIIWATLRPKKLVFSIEEAAIHEYNITNSKLNSTFDFTIRAYNPNHRISVYYDKIQVGVEYDGQVMATRVIDPFLQGHKNVTLLRTESVARNVVLTGSNQYNIKRERTTDSEVDLDVRVTGKIRFKVGRWKSGHYKLKVLCSPVVVVYSDPKRFEPVKCEVDI